MKPLSPIDAARSAIATNPERPATAVIHDTDDLRLVVFRLAPGQSVPPHRSVSSVMLTVLEGDGTLSGDGEEKQCTAGDVVTYDPNELHGMRAGATDFLLLATITPRPGSR